MKKVILMMTVVAARCGCNNADENEVYSCDKQLNEWAHDNLRTIRSMDRESWLQLDEQYKRPAFNALTPAQKVLFWKDKIQEVLTLDWNAQEEEHILKLYQYFDGHPNMYEEEVLNDSVKQDDFQQFAAKWRVDALFDLGWTEEQVYGIIFTGNRMINKMGEFAISYAGRLRTLSESSSDDNCGCNSSEKGCDYDCKNKTVTGCGIAYALSCNGKR